MAVSEWRLSLKLLDQPSLPKSLLQFPEAEPGDVPPGQYRVATLKQLVSVQLPDAIPDPELIELVYCGRKLRDELTLDSYGIQSGSTVHILRKAWPEPEIHPEPVDTVAAAREFRVLQAALHTSSAYRDSVFKMLNNKESLDQIIVATPGLSSDPVALGVLQDKDLFMQFTDPSMLDMLISSHPALVNAIILVLHSVAGSVPAQQSAGSSRSVSSSSYGDMPGGFLFEGMSDDEEDFQSGNRSGPSSGSAGSSGLRPATLGYSGAVGPRPITQSELATALALASTPESSAVTPKRCFLKMSTCTYALGFAHGLTERMWICVCLESVAVSAPAAARYGNPGRGSDPAGPAGHWRRYPSCPRAHLCWGSAMKCCILKEFEGLALLSKQTLFIHVCLRIFGVGSQCVYEFLKIGYTGLK